MMYASADQKRTRIKSAQAGYDPFKALHENEDYLARQIITYKSDIDVPYSMDIHNSLIREIENKCPENTSKISGIPENWNRSAYICIYWKNKWPTLHNRRSKSALEISRQAG